LAPELRAENTCSSEVIVRTLTQSPAPASSFPDGKTNPHPNADSNLVEILDPADTQTETVMADWTGNSPPSRPVMQYIGW